MPLFWTILDATLRRRQPERLTERYESCRVGEGEAEDNFVGTRFDVPGHQIGNLVRLAHSDSCDLFGRAALCEHFGGAAVADVRPSHL